MAAKRKKVSKVNTKINIDKLSIKELKELKKRADSEYSKVEDTINKLQNKQYYEQEKLEVKADRIISPLCNRQSDLEGLLYDIEDAMYKKENPPQVCSECGQNKPKKARRY